MGLVGVLLLGVLMGHMVLLWKVVQLLSLLIDRLDALGGAATTGSCMAPV